jgi:hypothetical protein
MLFLSKDPSLATMLVEGLLRYWPFANSTKEVQFLNELLEVKKYLACVLGVGSVRDHEIGVIGIQVVQEIDQVHSWSSPASC